MSGKTRMARRKQNCLNPSVHSVIFIRLDTPATPSVYGNARRRTAAHPTQRE
jgi:hypothetical protein